MMRLPSAYKPENLLKTIRTFLLKSIDFSGWFLSRTHRLLISCIAIPLCVVIMMACGEDIAPVEDTFHNPDILTRQPWKVCCQTVTPAVCLRDYVFPETDLLAHRLPCEHDDIFVFEKNGIWQLHDGLTSCEPRQPTRITDGEWQFNRTGDSLTLQLINREGDNYNYRILHLDSALMVRRYQYVISPITYTVTENLQPVE